MPRTNEERILENNARFREANETISKAADELGAEMQRIPFLCECPVEGCVEIVQLTREEYSAVRQHPHHYLTAVGHEEQERPVGEVVSRETGYVVIEKERR